jgi:hypothetical protein
LKRSISRKHPPEARTQQVAALREHAVEVVAGPLQAAVHLLHRETHAARRQRHAESVEQGQQQRVGALVADQEAGVDAVG